MRKLGNTDIGITAIGLGVMQFAGKKMMLPELPQELKNDIVKAALVGGINWFDTAELYGFGVSERGLAEALQNAEKDDGEVLVATKWIPALRTARNISKTIGNRLQHLKPYNIGLHQVHMPWSLSSVEDQMNVMADLVEDGKIRSVGVSNFSAKSMRRAHEALLKRGLTLASNQVQYSLIHRDIETNGVLESAKELGITIIAWSPIASGVLSGKFHKHPELLKQKSYVRRASLERKLKRSAPIIDVLDEIAIAHQVTASQVALNWLINFHGETVVAIPGATKVSHAEESAGVMNFSLSREELIRIDKISLKVAN